MERFVWATQFILDPKYVFGLLPENREGADPFDLAETCRENLPLPTTVPRVLQCGEGKTILLNRSPKIDLFTGKGAKMFVSDRLHRAMRKAKMKPSNAFRRCRVLDR